MIKTVAASAAIAALLSPFGLTKCGGDLKAPDNKGGQDCNSGMCVLPGDHCDVVGSDGTYHGVWYRCTHTAKDGDEWVKENPQPKG
jgi:hypothetical protein